MADFEVISGWGEHSEVIYPLPELNGGEFPPQTSEDPIKTQPKPGSPEVTLVSFGEIINRRTGYETDTGERVYTRVFQAIFDRPYSDPRFCLNLPGLPQIGDVYIVEAAADLGARVVKREATEQESSWLYHVKIDYSSKYDIKDPKLNPTEIRAKISSSYETVLEATSTALDPADLREEDTIPIAASSGELYSPVQMIERPRLVLTFSRKETLVDYSDHLRWLWKVNRYPWFGFAPRQALIADIRTSETEQDGATYFDCTYQVKIDERGWNRVLLDQGYYELIGGVQHRIYEPSGAERTTPTLLDGSGRKLASGQPERYRAFRIYRSVNFRELRLPI